MELIKENYTVVNGEKTYFKTIIHNETFATLIFVHGASANADAWLPVLINLGDKVNTVAVDLPGHYRSEGEPKETIPEIADFIEDFIANIKAKLFLTGEVIYVGHSLGGGVGIELGVRRLPWLRKLVLVTTNSSLNLLSEEFLNNLKNGTMDKGFFKNGFSPASSPKLLESILARQGLTSIDATYKDFLAGSRFDKSKELHLITADTLIISGKDDRIMPKSSGKILHENIQNSKWVEIENAGHFVTLENPIGIIQSINKYIL